MESPGPEAPRPPSRERSPERSAGDTAGRFKHRLERWTGRAFALLPHHLLSRIVFRLTRLTAGPLKNLAIRAVVWWYGIDLSEAAERDLAAYPTFNAFFTRPLRPEARPVVKGRGEVACPVDGTVSQVGEIEEGRIFQAKGRDYSVEELLAGGPEDRPWPGCFRDGAFATLYLAPSDYHRIHMPVTGRLEEMVHVPGRLFSVQPWTVRAVPQLFARNERVVTLFETAAGPLAVVLVGALFVAAIETVWAGLVTPPRSQVVVRTRYPGTGPKSVHLDRGEEMGRFNMGSTVIVLFPPGVVEWAEEVRPGEKVRMGERLGWLRG